MTKKITSIFTLLIFCVTITAAQNFSALYTFDSIKTTSGLTDPTPAPTAIGVTFGSFSATGTPANPSSASRFNFINWPTGAVAGDDLYSSLTGSINVLEYYEVTITPNPTYTVDLTSITFSVQRSGTGIRTYAVRSSADSYLTNLPASIDPVNTKLSVQTGDVFFWNLDATTTNQNGSTITLSGPDFTSITSPITFRFYGWNAEGAAGTFSIDNVTISGIATPPLTANFSTTNICFGNSTPFTDLSIAGIGTVNSWTWDFGDGDSSAFQSPTHFYNIPGTYLVTLIVSDNMLNIDTVSASVTVYENPVADFSFSVIGGSTVNYIDLSTSASDIIASWFWKLNNPVTGNDTSYLQNPTHTYPADIPVTACLTVTNSFGCKDSVCKEVFSVGINTIFSEPSVTIYPNPSANGLFTIDLGAVSNKTIVTVYSIIGKLILTKELNATTKQLLDLSKEANGSYFITIKNENSIVTRKITINR